MKETYDNLRNIIADKFCNKCVSNITEHCMERQIAKVLEFMNEKEEQE